VPHKRNKKDRYKRVRGRRPGISVTTSGPTANNVTPPGSDTTPARHRRPSDAEKRLAPFLQLANVELPNADDYEDREPPPPPSLIDQLKAPEQRDEDAEAIRFGQRLITLGKDSIARAKTRKARLEWALELARRWQHASPATADDFTSPERRRSFEGVADDTRFVRGVKAGVLRLEGTRFIFASDDEAAARELYELRHAIRVALRAISERRSCTVGVFDSFTIDADGLVRVRSGPWGFFRDAIRGLPAARFRCCRVCDKFFFARRSNMKACSRRCAQIERTRRWRAKQAELEVRRKFKRRGVRDDDPYYYFKTGGEEL